MPAKFSLAALKLTSRAKSEDKEAPNVDSNSKSTAEDDYPHGARLFLTAISLGLTIFLVALDGTIVSTAIPAIAGEFHSVSEVGWVSWHPLPECAGEG